MQPLADLLLSISLQRQATCLAFNALTDHFVALFSADVFFSTFLFLQWFLSSLQEAEAFHKENQDIIRGSNAASLRCQHVFGMMLGRRSKFLHTRPYNMISATFSSEKKRKIARQACHNSM
jgi:hypothetical protein